MARIRDREDAIKLRKQGYTYSEIKDKFKIRKSTLSNWLSKFHLSNDELEILSKKIISKKQLGMEKTRSVKAKKRDGRLAATYEAEKKRLIPLSKGELYIAGLFLYWGEGSKSIRSTGVGLVNTDPQVLKFFLFWLEECLNLSRDKLRVQVHLYSDMGVDEHLDYWSKELNIPRSQFSKPYIKESKRIDITHKGFGKGTCGVYFHNARLKETVILGIKALADYYSSLI